ncbi:hypothetical protein NC652_001067 [Populus alba x Populus x berolinensis]|nr:hypothetical protein NC652_001067 [Populus alba x Populus x berolinensis]
MQIKKPKSDGLVNETEGLFLSKMEGPKLWQQDHNSKLYPKNRDELAGINRDQGTRRGPSLVGTIALNEVVQETKPLT